MWGDALLPICPSPIRSHDPKLFVAQSASGNPSCLSFSISLCIIFIFSFFLCLLPSSQSNVYVNFGYLMFKLLSLLFAKHFSSLFFCFSSCFLLLFICLNNLLLSFLHLLFSNHRSSQQHQIKREREKEREREGEKRERLLAVALYLCYAVDRSIVPLFILLFAIISFCHSFFVRFSPLLNRHLEEKETINQSTDKN